MEDELEGIELDYLRRQALNTITPKKRGGSRHDHTRQLESEFGIDALFRGEKPRSSPRKGRPMVRRGRSTPELSREVINTFSNRPRRSPRYNYHPKQARGGYERYPPSNFVHESYPVATGGRTKESMRKKHKPRKRRRSASSSRSSYSSSSGSRSSYSSSRSSSRSRSRSSSSSSRSSYSRSRSSSSSSYSKSSYSSSPSRSASPASRSKKKLKQSRHHTLSHSYKDDSHEKKPSKKLTRPRPLSSSLPLQQHHKRPRLSLDSPPDRAWYPDPPMYDRSPYDSHGGHLRTLPPDLRKGRLPRHEAEWSSKPSRHPPPSDDYEVDGCFSPPERHYTDYQHGRLRGPPQRPPSREARVVRHVSGRYPPDKPLSREFYDKAPPPRRPLSPMLAPRSHRGEYIRHGRVQREGYSPDRNRHGSERFQLSRPRWEEGGRRVYTRQSPESRYGPDEAHSTVRRTHLPEQGYSKVSHRSRRERSRSVDAGRVVNRYKEERRERGDYHRLENVQKTERSSDTKFARDSNSKSTLKSKEKEATKTMEKHKAVGKGATVKETAKVVYKQKAGKEATVKETAKVVDKPKAGKEVDRQKPGMVLDKQKAGKEAAVKDVVKHEAAVKVAVKEEVVKEVEGKEIETVVKEVVSEPPALHEEVADSPPEVNLQLQQSPAEIDNMSDLLGTSGSGPGEEELDYDESMEGLDLFPTGSLDVGSGDMGREASDNQQESGDGDKSSSHDRGQKGSRAKGHETGSDAGSEAGSPHKKRRRNSSTESESSSGSEDDGEGSRIMSPIRITPERKGSRMVRKTSSHQSSDKLPVKERLYVSKRDIERKKRLISTDDSEPPSKLRPSLANRLGPSPYSRSRHDWPRHRSDTRRPGGSSGRTHKGNAFAIAEAFRRKKRQEEVLRKEDMQKAKKLTKMLNEPDPKAIPKKVEQYDSDGNVVEKERALDRRIGELKEQNKAIIKRNREIEMDKQIYG